MAETLTHSKMAEQVDHVTDILSRPIIGPILSIGAALWIGGNLMLGGTGGLIDRLGWLELAATLGALIIAVLILVTQRREDHLAERRAQLTLELALLADKKSAKIIALLEEMRRDNPIITNRIDEESNEMANPADPMIVLAAIDERAGEKAPARRPNGE